MKNTCNSPPLPPIGCSVRLTGNHSKNLEASQCALLLEASFRSISVCSSQGVSSDPEVIFLAILFPPLPFLRITPGSRTPAASIGLQGCLFPPVTRCRVEYSSDVKCLRLASYNELPQKIQTILG